MIFRAQNQLFWVTLSAAIRSVSSKTAATVAVGHQGGSTPGQRTSVEVKSGNRSHKDEGFPECSKALDQLLWFLNTPKMSSWAQMSCCIQVAKAMSPTAFLWQPGFALPRDPTMDLAVRQPQRPQREINAPNVYICAI